MALTSETQPSPKGVDCIERESLDALNEGDLEDGEIYEDEDPPVTKVAPVATAPVATALVPTAPVPQPKPNPIPETPRVVPVKPVEPLRNNRIFNDISKPEEEHRVPFFKGKRKIMDNEEEDRWKRDGKRNRRSQEFERDREPGRARLDGEPGEDEEEMMFIRGASPHHPNDEKWDQEGDDEERGDMQRRPMRNFRGRGIVSRRGDRQRIRGRGRGVGAMRVNNKRKREEDICVYFLQGKCHRGPDCPFLHEVLPPRKNEMCKFYMKDCCMKKDKCLYMHAEFPCKYFHTGLKCFANKKCKFSHAPLTESTRNILAKHLDTAPQELLGDFNARRDREQRERGDSRDMRGDARDMRGDARDMRGDSRDMRGDSRDIRNDFRDMRNDSRDMRNDSRDMRNDSREMRGDSRDLRSDSRDMRGDGRDMRDESRGTRCDSRDMRVDYMRNKHDRDRKIPSLFDIKVTIPEDMRFSDGATTPMASPTHRSLDSTRSSDRDHGFDHERDKDREREKDKDKDKEKEKERQRLEKAERSKERKAKREKAREHRKERRERKVKEKEKKRERSKNVISDKIENGKQSPDTMSTTDTEENIRSSVESVQLNPEEREKKPAAIEVNGLFPQHLPKKQQELFLRIQQQQREAETSLANARDEEEDDQAEEDNWYSSDEEMPPAPLSTITVPPPPQTSSVTPILNILASATAAPKPLEVAPTTPVPFIPANLDLSNLSTVFEALSNLQKMNSTAKPVEKPQTTLVAVVEAKPDPLTIESSRKRDPRLLRSDFDVAKKTTEGYADMDLRPVPKPSQSSGDVDLRSLPFKPVQHSAAKEIDASLASHSPITWELMPVDVVKADYSILKIQPQPGVIDPRLRRVVRPPTDELGLPRDPRQRLLDEPQRPRPALLCTPIVPPSPRYDEDHRLQFYGMDSDMRQFPPPTPRLEDEVYTPIPSRPMDPRQRAKAIEDPRRPAVLIPRPDDIDLRTQLAQRVQFVNFK